MPLVGRTRASAPGAELSKKGASFLPSSGSSPRGFTQQTRRSGACRRRLNVNIFVGLPTATIIPVEVIDRAVQAATRWRPGESRRPDGAAPVPASSGCVAVRRLHICQCTCPRILICLITPDPGRAIGRQPGRLRRLAPLAHGDYDPPHAGEEKGPWPDAHGWEPRDRPADGPAHDGGPGGIPL
jgi:hypothetical protein